MIIETDPPMASLAPAKKPLYAQLYVQVLVAIVAGVLLGHFAPAPARR